MEARFTDPRSRHEFSFTDSDVVNPHEYASSVNTEGEPDRHHVKAWLIHDHGYTVAVVFGAESDALDIAADAGKLDRWKVAPADMGDYGDTEEEQWERLTSLGNDGAPFDIENAGMVPIPLPTFSFAACMTAAANELTREVARADEKARRTAETYLDFRTEMIQNAQQAFSGGETERAHACLAHALDFRFS